MFRAEIPPSVQVERYPATAPSPFASPINDVKFTLLMTIGLVVLGDLRVPAELSPRP